MEKKGRKQPIIYQRLKEQTLGMYQVGFTLKEISEKLGISKSTAWRRLQNAKNGKKGKKFNQFQTKS